MDPITYLVLCHGGHTQVEHGIPMKRRKKDNINQTLLNFLFFKRHKFGLYLTFNLKVTSKYHFKKCKTNLKRPGLTLFKFVSRSCDEKSRTSCSNLLFNLTSIKNGAGTHMLKPVTQSSDIKATCFAVFIFFCSNLIEHE